MAVSAGNGIRSWAKMAPEYLADERVRSSNLFVKGANQGPTRMALAEATADELAGDVALAGDAGLDLLRVHAHVSRRDSPAAFAEGLHHIETPCQAASLGLRTTARLQIAKLLSGKYERHIRPRPIATGTGLGLGSNRCGERR